VNGNSLDPLEEQVLLDIVHLVLVVAEDDDWRSRLLQALEQIDHLGLQFDIFDDLQDVQVGGTCSADVNKHGPNKRLLGKVLNLSGHRGGEK
jgi:hypothetical protein